MSAHIAFPTGTRVKVSMTADTDFKGCQGHTGEVVQITGYGSVSEFQYLYDQPYEVRFDEPVKCTVPYDDGTPKGTTVQIVMNKIWFDASDLILEETVASPSANTQVVDNSEMSAQNK